LNFFILLIFDWIFLHAEPQDNFFEVAQTETEKAVDSEKQEEK
jgi:hypothetical protein